MVPKGGRMSRDSSATKRFRVALSFPGEYDDRVRAIAERLAVRFGQNRVLYDKFHDAEFARPDLDVYLPDLYRTQSDLIVVFLCPEYAKKRWCRLELRAVRQLIGSTDSSRIMYLSFGDPGDLTEMGILPGDGFIDIAKLSAEAVEAKIGARLGLPLPKPRPAGPLRVAILLGHSRREPLPEAAEMATAAVAYLRHSGLAIELTIDQATRDALDRVEARGGCDLLLFYGHGETDGSLQWADGKMWFDDLAGTPSRKSFWETLDGVIVFACHGASFAVHLPCPWMAFDGALLRNVPKGLVYRIAQSLKTGTLADAMCAVMGDTGGAVKLSDRDWPARAVDGGAFVIRHGSPAVLGTSDVEYLTVSSQSEPHSDFVGSPIVGRDGPLESLGRLPRRDATDWLDCHWVSGEPCVGKSSLLMAHAELVRTLAFSDPANPVWLLHAYCQNYFSSNDLQRHIVAKANKLYGSRPIGIGAFAWKPATTLDEVGAALKDVPGSHVWILDDVSYTSIDPNDPAGVHRVPSAIARLAVTHALAMQLVVSARRKGPSFQPWNNLPLEEIPTGMAIELGRGLYREACLPPSSDEDLGYLHRQVAGRQLTHFKRGVRLAIERGWSIRQYAEELVVDGGIDAIQQQEHALRLFRSEMRVLQGLAPKYGFDFGAFLGRYWRLMLRAGHFTTQELENWFGDAILAQGSRISTAVAYRNGMRTLQAVGLVVATKSSGEESFVMPPNQRINIQALSAPDMAIPPAVPDRGAREGVSALIERFNRGDDGLTLLEEIDDYRAVYEHLAHSPQVAVDLCLSHRLRAVIAAKMHGEDAAIREYREIDTRFGKCTDEGLVEQVAEALFDQGVMLKDFGQSDKSMAVYDDVVSRFGSRSEPGILEHVARALVNKGATLGMLGRSDEAITVLSDVASRFGSLLDPRFATQVAKALVNKGVTLGQLDRSEDSITVYDDVDSRFGSRPEPGIAEHVTAALVGKGFTLGRYGRSHEAIVVYDDVVSRFGARPEPGIAEHVARALVNKGVTLGQLGRSEEAIVVFDDVVSRFGARPEAGIAEQVARALGGKGSTLGQVGRSDEEIVFYDDVVSRFGARQEPGIAGAVAITLVNKGFRLVQRGEPADAVVAYGAAVLQLRETESSPATLLRAAAGIGIEVAEGERLRRLREFDAAISRWDAVIASHGERQEEAIVEQIALAHFLKGRLFETQRAFAAAIGGYDALIQRYGHRTEPGIAEQVKKAKERLAVLTGPGGPGNTGSVMPEA